MQTYMLLSCCALPLAAVPERANGEAVHAEGNRPHVVVQNDSSRAIVVSHDSQVCPLEAVSLTCGQSQQQCRLCALRRAAIVQQAVGDPRSISPAAGPRGAHGRD